MRPKQGCAIVPLTKLLGRRGLTGTRLLLALATTKASTLHKSTSTSTTAAATSTTAAAASAAAAATSTTPTAATEALTPATTPTSTATPSASSTASTAAPTVPSTTLAPFAFAVAAPPTRSRRSPDLRSANCQRELCVGPRPRLGGADFVVGCTGGTANLQQWATPTWASWSTGLVDLHGATAMPLTWEAGG
ncbi:unnamed protein product [Closterium sp. NIES-53]